MLNVRNVLNDAERAKDKKAPIGVDVTIENFSDEIIDVIDLLDDLALAPEPPKQDISTLKKRIKYCKNPMEKKKLEQELNALYKEHKRNRRTT